MSRRAAIKNRQSKIKNGFTLIELLVVIAIIALLLALLLPAVQKVREAANKMRCANNLKQFGVGIHTFIHDHGRLPPARAGWAYSAMNDKGSWLVHVLPYMEQTQLYQKFQNQLNEGPGSVQLLPRWYEIKPPEYQRCPSDDWDHDAHPSTNYAGSMGPTCAFSPCGYQPYQWKATHCVLSGEAEPPPGIQKSSDFGDDGGAAGSSAVRGCFARLGNLVTLKMIKDGLSNTIMVGEVRPYEHDHLSSPDLYGGCFANGAGQPWSPDIKQMWPCWNGGAAHAGTLPPINYRTDQRVRCNTFPEGLDVNTVRPTPDYGNPEVFMHSYQNWNLSMGFKSRHPGGAHFLFADGSVHFLPEEINYAVYQYLGERHDGRHIEEW